MNLFLPVALLVISLSLVACDMKKKEKLEPLTEKQLQVLTETTESVNLIRRSIEQSGASTDPFSLPAESEEDIKKALSGCDKYLPDPNKLARRPAYNSVDSFRVVGSKCPVAFEEVFEYAVLFGGARNGEFNLKLKYRVHDSSFAKLSDIEKIDSGGLFKVKESSEGIEIHGVVESYVNSRSVGKISQILKISEIRLKNREIVEKKVVVEQEFPGFKVRGEMHLKGPRVSYYINDESISGREFSLAFGSAYKLKIPFERISR